MRFLVVGMLSFAVDYGLYAILLNWLQYVLASSISFSVSLILNYILTLSFVFKASPGRNIAREFVYFLGLNIIALGLNQLVLFASVALFGASEFVGKIIATAIVLMYNFVSRKLLIERSAAPRTRRTRRGVSSLLSAADLNAADGVEPKPLAP